MLHSQVSKKVTETNGLVAARVVRAFVFVLVCAFMPLLAYMRKRHI